MIDNKTTTTPTLEDINDMTDAYQKDLDIRDLHLKDIVVFQSEDIDRLFDILKEPDKIDFTRKEDKDT